MGNFRKLKVWVLAKDLAVETYQLVDKSEKMRSDFRFKNQMTSSAVSIPSNIAEGDESNTKKQTINYFYIAKGSCAELITQLIIAQELKMVDVEKAKKLISKTNLISFMLYRLIMSRRSKA